MANFQLYIQLLQISQLNAHQSGNGASLGGAEVHAPQNPGKAYKGMCFTSSVSSETDIVGLPFLCESYFCYESNGQAITEKQFKNAFQDERNKDKEVSYLKKMVFPIHVKLT